MRVSRLLPALALAATAVIAAPDSPTLHAAGRGAPRLNLLDGRALPGVATLASATPLALTAVDLDRDGRAELLAGYATADGRGAIACWSPREPAPPVVVGLDAPPRWIGALDVDADGRLDVVAAADDGLEVAVLLGDGRGALRPGRAIAIGAPIAALATADLGRGTTDLVLARGGAHPELQVWRSGRHAFEVEPLTLALPAPVAALAAARFEDRAERELVLACGNTLLLVRAAKDTLEIAERHALAAPALAIAGGRFVPGDAAHDDLAVLLADGRLQLLTTPAFHVARETALDPAYLAGATLASGKLATGAAQDLVIALPATHDVRIAISGDDPVLDTTVLAADAAPLAAAVVPADAGGAAALAVLLQADAAPRVAALSASLKMVVTSTADTPDANPGNGTCADASGACTLRAAIMEANASQGLDRIEFELGTGTPKIALASSLPSVGDAIEIAGNTGGASRIELNATATAAPGLRLLGPSSGSRITALVINRTPAGQPAIRIESGSNVVEGCWLGPDAAGTGSVAANGGAGVLVIGPLASQNTIGGGLRNVISNNAGPGVVLDTNVSQNTVSGNWIGVAASGTARLANGGGGVLVRARAMSNVIGGETSAPGTAPGNVISGNTGSGIKITGSGTNGTIVAGNLVGLGPSGAAALGNGGDGITITDGSQSARIGGATVASRNVVSGNASDGIEFDDLDTFGNAIEGNYVGTDVTGAHAVANAGSGVLLQVGVQSAVIGAATDMPGQPPGNLISGNGQDGVRVVDAPAAPTGWSDVKGNLIGTNASGTAALANGRHGISLEGGTLMVIGGTSVAERNVISGNVHHGVSITGGGANGTTIEGCYIGTDIHGTSAIANGGNGVRLEQVGGESMTSNTVGEAVPGRYGEPPGNVISGNGSDGIALVGDACDANHVHGNLVGLDATGKHKLPNGRHGIYAADGAWNNLIGGWPAGNGNEGNAIAGNDARADASGVYVTGELTAQNMIAGNRIGTDIDGALAIPNGHDGITITGMSFGNQVGAFTMQTGVPPGNLISGHTLQPDSVGIRVEGAATDDNAIVGNLVGTDATGYVALGNRFAGILVTNGPRNTQIGNPGGPGMRNIISGNHGPGIELDRAPGSTVIHAWVGVDASGFAALKNAGDGLLVTDGGGLAAAGGHVIGGQNGWWQRSLYAGNAGHGVHVVGALAGGNVFSGDFYGVGDDGVTPVPNGGDGILIEGAPNNTIGKPDSATPGDCTGSCNLIALNTGAGVRIVGDATGNAVRYNAIVANGALGIDLAGAGITPNDPLDADGGCNLQQNFPTLATAASYDGANTTVTGMLQGAPNAAGLVIDVYGSSAPDPSGYGQGQRWLGSVSDLVTDAAGNVTWQLVVPGLPAVLSATATDAAGNTSEFGPAFRPVFDLDGDGVVDALDCAPADNALWSVPAEVAGDVFTDARTLRWDGLATQAGPATAYDVLRGSRLPFGSAPDETCVARSLNATSLDVPGAPPAGTPWFFLVRGHNACGAGTYGSGSNGAERVSSTCP